jgi:hypothetical protein
MAFSNIIFVDHRQKMTLDLKDLGLTAPQFIEKIAVTKKVEKSENTKEQSAHSTTSDLKSFEIPSFGNISGSIINMLLATQNGGGGAGMPLPKKKKRKRKGPFNS